MSISSPGSAGQRRPAVAYGDGVYLLAWREGFSGYKGKSDILAMRIGTDGKPLDREPIPVCTKPGIRDLPSVAFCAGEFMVAWAPRPRPIGEELVHVLRTRRIGSNGTLDPLTHSMFGRNPKTWPALVSNGKDEFLLAWQEAVDGHYAVRGTRISAATDEWLDVPHLEIMSPNEELGSYWATGGRIGVAWMGKGYVVCQSDVVTYLDPLGKPLLPLQRAWNVRGGSGGYTVTEAWGRGFVFVSSAPRPSAWGRGATGAILGTTVEPESCSREWEAFLKLMPDMDKHHVPALIADGHVLNCLDRAQWLNHPAWPGGMHGGLKHTMGDVWPSGLPAAAFNGRSLVVVWPRGHLADNRRLFNRDLYLARLLPGWARADAEPVPVATAGTEENNPVMCAGPKGQTLLAYEKLTEEGPVIRYRLLNEEPDIAPPSIVRVMPMSRTEMVVTFDEPIEESGVKAPDVFRIAGIEVTKAEFSPDARSACRDVILTTSPPQEGKTYTLNVKGIRDRSPAQNEVAGASFAFLAKPGFMQQSETVYQWDNARSSERSYPNPDRIGIRDFICRWALLGPLPRNTQHHPFDPATVLPSPGDKVRVGTATLTWKAADGEAIDLGIRLGKKGNQVIYASTYVFSEESRKAVLRLDSNDHNRAWWNGRLVNDGIGTAAEERRFHVYTDEVPIRLKPGWNRLLLQVENHVGEWMMVGQITDAVGRPIRDLTWQIERPGGVGP